MLYNKTVFDDFFDAYLVCALWSSTDSSNDECEPLDENFAISDIHPDSYQKLLKEALQFFNSNYDHIENNLEQAGHDFWLTRNGHGAGFWDRDDSIWPKKIRDLLTAESKKFGEIDLYVGDDNKLHV